MKELRTIKFFVGTLIISVVAISCFAVATDRLVNSIDTYKLD